MRAIKAGARLLAMVFGSFVLAACFATPGSAAEAPGFPGYPPTAPYGGSQCRTVLLIGDSMMTPNGDAVRSTLSDSGRCANVINAAVNGSAPTGNLQGVDWAATLSADIARHRPAIVVMEFVGNGFTATNGDAWLTQLEQGMLNLIAIARDGGAAPYVAIPPDPLAHPAPNLVGMNRFVAWQHATDVGAPKIDLGAELSPSGYTDSLSFPDGPMKVRADVVHTTELGAYISGYTVAAGIQAEWPTPAPVSASPSSQDQATSNRNVTVTGASFVDGATASFSAPGITVNSTAFVSATELTANIHVAANTPLGAADVTVTNPDGATSSCSGCFTVIQPSPAAGALDRRSAEPHPAAFGATVARSILWTLALCAVCAVCAVIVRCRTRLLDLGRP